MRQFIVTNPNLSVGKPGDVVTSEQLHMSDEKLDEWVKAGYATEIHDGPVVVDNQTVSDTVDVQLDRPYNPSFDTVSQVLDHVEAHPEQAAAVLAAERADRNRSGIVDVLDPNG